MFKTIYCDFDGTITKQDAVNTFLAQFTGDKWLESEELWRQGKLSSRENAIIQVGLLPKIDKKTFNDFINSIEVDEYFYDFYKLIKSQNKNLIILSDGFDLFIQKILERFNIQDVKFYANHLVYENDKFSIEFPYYTENCEKKSGMCKCQFVKEDKFCYIGDGVSDLCIARKANLLFASKDLNNYCKHNVIKHISFNNFDDIIKTIKID